MINKPIPEEFDISRDGMRHAPTQALFVPMPGNPTIGVWSDGHGKPKNGAYDLKEVHELGRKLWAKFLVKTKS